MLICFGPRWSLSEWTLCWIALVVSELPSRSTLIDSPSQLPLTGILGFLGFLGFSNFLDTLCDPMVQDITDLIPSSARYDCHGEV